MSESCILTSKIVFASLKMLFQQWFLMAQWEDCHLLNQQYLFMYYLIILRNQYCVEAKDISMCIYMKCIYVYSYIYIHSDSPFSFSLTTYL